MFGSSFRSYLHLHFLVLIWGFTAIVGLMVSISPVVLVLYRALIAAVGLLFIILFRKGEFVRPSKKDIASMLMIGMMVSGHWVLFFAAARVSTASVCLAGLATTSLWTSLIEPFANKSKVSPIEVGLGILAFAGLFVVFRFEFDHALGLVLALISAILAATFTVANSKLVKRNTPYIITFYEMVGATIFTFPLIYFSKWMGWTSNVYLIPQPSDWIWILFLALVCTVYASTMAVQLMKQFSAYLINLTINLEPVYGITLAFLIFGEKEKMTLGFYIGTLVILLAVLLYPILNNKFVVTRRTK